MQAVDPDGNPVTLSVENGIAGFALPSFVTLTDNGGGNGILHFNPPAGNRGTYTLTLLATDNGDGLGPPACRPAATRSSSPSQSATQLPVLNYIGDQVAVIGQPFTLNLHGEREPTRTTSRTPSSGLAGRRDPDARELRTAPPRSTGRRPRPTPVRTRSPSP